MLLSGVAVIIVTQGLEHAGAPNLTILVEWFHLVRVQATVLKILPQQCHQRNLDGTCGVKNRIFVDCKLFAVVGQGDVQTVGAVYFLADLSDFFFGYVLRNYRSLI